jgi:hypothetical protein
LDFNEINGSNFQNKSDFIAFLSKQCPSTPFDEVNWNMTCPDDWYKTFGQADEGETYDVQDHSVLRQPMGDGIGHGLQVRIGSLPCGWLSTDIFNGSRVLLIRQQTADMCVNKQLTFVSFMSTNS